MPEKLTLLIESLTKEEKAHFKKTNAGYSKGTQYTKLFDLVNKNPNVSRKQVQQELGITAAQTKNYMHYVFDKVLDSSTRFTLRSSLDQQLFAQLQSSFTLKRKGLSKLAYESLMSVYETALRVEDYGIALSAVEHIDTRLLTVSGHFDTHEELVNELSANHKRKVDVMDLYRQASRFDWYLNELWVYSTDMSRRDSFEKMAVINEQFQKEDPPPSNNKTACIRKNMFELLYAVMIDEPSTGLKSGERALAIYHTDKKYQDYHVHKYLQLIQSIGINYGKSGDRKKFEETVQLTIEAYESPSNKGDMMVFHSVFSAWVNQLAYRVENGLTEEAYEMADEISSTYLEKIDRLISPVFRVILYSCMAKAYFGKRDYLKARKFYRLILNQTPTEVSGDIHSLSRINLLVVYFKLGETDTIESQIKSTYRYLLKKEKLHGEEHILLRNIPKLCNAFNDEKMIAVFEGIKRDLSELRGSGLSMQNPFRRTHHYNWVCEEILHLKSRRKVT